MERALWTDNLVKSFRRRTVVNGVSIRLKAGEVVVTSGNFLIAAESKLKSAAQKW